MKTIEFQGLLAEIEKLPEGQRRALQEALAGTVGPAGALALIEQRFAEAPACGHCDATHFVGWGSASGLKRYKCKACGRTFNALTGTPLAQLHRRDAWLDYAQCVVDGLSLRKAAKRALVCLGTSFRWRHRFLEAAQDRKAAVVAGVVEADETFILKSAKGSRRLVGRKARKRGGKAKAPGISTDLHDCVLIVRDRHGATTDALLPDLEGPTFAAELEPVVAKDAVLVTDGRAAYGQFADAAGILHISLIASKGERSYGSYHIQNANAYASRLKGWLRPFKGVASKYLGSYLGWRRTIERDGDKFTREACLVGAYG